MTAPSKAAPAILSIFGLPFLGMGLFAAFTFLRAPDQPLASRIGAAMFASVFAIIGAGLIFGSLYGYSRQKQQAERELANPHSRWLWRQDWAAGRVESKNKASARGMWIVAVLVNMLSLPVSLAGIFQALKTQNPKYFILAAFEIVGLIALIAAIRATIRFERFGKTYFEMNSLPFSPGNRVAGSIHVQLPPDATHGVDLKLTCLRRVITNSGNNRVTQQVPLWEDSKNVPAASLVRGPLDTLVAVDFAIPGEAFQTDHDNFNDQVLWLLKANADVPGVDYSDEFEIPVFSSTVSAAVSPAQSWSIPGSVERRGFLASTTTPGETTAEVSEPARHRVVVRESPDGLEFYFRAGRNPGRAILIVILAACCTALFYAMLHIHPEPPKFAFAIVGLLSFVLIVASIHTALTSTRIVVGNGLISWRRSILGIPSSSRQIQISEIESIVPVTSIQQASSSGNTLYSLRLRTKDEKNYTLADDIISRQEARWLVSQMEQRAGLRLNTQVEISNAFYGPPPQPAETAASAPVASDSGFVRRDV